MSKIDSTILKETRYVFFVSLILSLIMQAAFLISGYWNYTFIWGNILGLAASVGNFLLMGLTVQKALGKEEKEIKKLVQLSQSGRLFILLIVALIANFVSVFSLLATVIPYIFLRIAVMIRPLIVKD